MPFLADAKLHLIFLICKYSAIFSFRTRYFTLINKSFRAGMPPTGISDTTLSMLTQTSTPVILIDNYKLTTKKSAIRKTGTNKPENIVFQRHKDITAQQKDKIQVVKRPLY